MATYPHFQSFIIFRATVPVLRTVSRVQGPCPLGYKDGSEGHHGDLERARRAQGGTCTPAMAQYHGASRSCVTAASPFPGQAGEEESLPGGRSHTPGLCQEKTPSGMWHLCYPP